MEVTNLLNEGLQVIEGKRTNKENKFSKLDSMDKFTIILALEEKQKRLESQLRNNPSDAENNIIDNVLNSVINTLDKLR